MTGASVMLLSRTSAASQARSMTIYDYQRKEMLKLLGPEFAPLRLYLDTPKDPWPELARANHPLFARFLRACMAHGGYNQALLVEASGQSQGSLSKNLSGERLPALEKTAGLACGLYRLDPQLGASSREIMAQLGVFAEPELSWNLKIAPGELSQKGLKEFVGLMRQEMARQEVHFAELSIRSGLSGARIAELLMADHEQFPLDNVAMEEIAAIQAALQIKRGSRSLSIGELTTLVFPPRKLSS